MLMVRAPFRIVLWTRWKLIREPDRFINFRSHPSSRDYDHHHQSMLRDIRQYVCRVLES